MLCYISSPIYQPLIQKVITETDQVCMAHDLTGDKIFLKKYVKEKITQFENVDTFLIDLTAVSDTDEEVMAAIESLRIMDYSIRFIILAPYKEEGDKFLKECFYAGIYDIIITDEYLQMSQELNTCISVGMRYKDALRFRDSVKEEKKQDSCLAVQKILVGISGVGQRMGSTHNSIVIANFLRTHNQMVAVMEMNDTKVFEKVCAAQKAKLFAEGYFTHAGVDYYPECTSERVAAVAGKLYNFIILDFGNYSDTDKVLFNKCDVRMLFAGTKPWELDRMESIFKEQDEDVLKRYHFCFLITTSRKLQKEIIEHMKPLENIWFPEYTENPFESSLFPEGQKIFEEYLNNTRVLEKKKKRIFSRNK